MSAAIYEKQGNVMTIKPQGRLDTATSPVLEKEMREHLDGIQELIMDFANVEYISSGGLRILLTTERQMENRGGSMKVIHVNQHILEIFDLVGFMDVITVARD